MDLTPESLRAVEFRGTRASKGYNHVDVDEFVAKVAAGVGELLEQIRLTAERATQADLENVGLREAEDAMRRTLVHAQKLADALLAEAGQEAARLREESEVVRAADQVRFDQDRAAAIATLKADRAFVAEAKAAVDEGPVGLERGDGCGPILVEADLVLSLIHI